VFIDDDALESSPVPNEQRTDTSTRMTIHPRSSDSNICKSDLHALNIHISDFVSLPATSESWLNLDDISVVGYRSTVGAEMITFLRVVH
jgi:hypothetical protein